MQISANYLKKIWESENPSEEELQKFFTVDNSHPFSPKLVLKENIQILNEETNGVEDLGVALDIFNWSARKKRKQRYFDFIRFNPRRIKIVSEGDSWFQHPMITDTIDYLLKYYPVFSLGAAGDTLRNMHKSAEWLKAINEIEPKIFLISAGGNDILGEQFEGFLSDFSGGYEPGQNPSRFINSTFSKELESIRHLYRDILETLKKENQNLSVIIHGYDHVIPNNTNVPNKWYQSKDKSWLGDYMIKKGITNPEDKNSIIVYMMRQFNDMLIEFDKEFEHVHYLDLRGTIRDDQWYDEIHPNSNGYQDIAVKYKEKIREFT